MFRFTCYHCSFLLFFLLFVSFKPVRGQENWLLATNQEGIKVYTRHMADSKIKAVKVSCDMQSSQAQLLAAILDVKTCDKWVYHSKKNVLVKQISALDLIYYSEVEVPWPAENRDYVVHIQVDQDQKTKVITVNSPCIPGYVPEKDNIVRINHSVGKWVITPAGKDHVSVEYLLEVDPMGNIPAWLINLFATKGPLETFRKLKIHVQEEVYKKAHFAMIRE